MVLGAIDIFVGLLLALGAGFLAAWLIRQESMNRSATYASSLEQVLAGTMRERDAVIERERIRKLELGKTAEALNARLLELERELGQRETQVIAFRDEALLLSRTREELVQRLAWQEQQARENEARLTARVQELQNGAAARGPGQRPTGAERELAALIAAHENDLAELEARYLQLLQSRDAEIERLGAARVSQPVTVPDPDVSAPRAEPATTADSLAADSGHLSAPNGGGQAPFQGPRSRRTRRRRSRDDLKQIAGIDDSLEQALHLVGITSFRQVARWKEKDIDRMAKKLYQSPERIRDEQWVERAREAFTRKYGTTP
jgi:predicted flap endonuclease-1-like 5' DNA nuclease